MRPLLIAALIMIPAAAPAQLRRLTRADSALIGRILHAEDARDSADTALSSGLRHSDAGVRALAQRARARIADPKFESRDSLPTPGLPPQSHPVWPEPAWRIRYRRLTTSSDCLALTAAVADSAWPVRLRAADLVSARCAEDAALRQTLADWIARLPSRAGRRDAGGISWQAAAHAIVALARARPADARVPLRRLVRHSQWQVRMYAAQAASALGDTAALRTLARDENDNVKAASIDLLSKLTGHADDDVFLAAVTAHGAQAVRAAALALAGSSRPDVHAAASAAFDRWSALENAPARDTRVALLAAAGRPASDERPPRVRAEVPPDAVALALGRDVRLRVGMSPSSGGGSFVVRLRGDVAPITSARILSLVRAHYYDGLSWHRVEPDFVIQGGSPEATEYVGYPRYFRDELGTVPHVRGTVGMSTRGHDTGDGQWFVNLRDNLRLNGDYTLFGEVLDGIDVVDGILEGDTIATIRLIPSSTSRH